MPGKVHGGQEAKRANARLGYDECAGQRAAGFLNTSFAILLGIAVAVVLFATFFPETPALRAVASAGSFSSTWATSPTLNITL